MAKTTQNVFIMVCLFSLNVAWATPEFSFKEKGKLIKTLTFKEMTALASPETIKVNEKHEMREVEYRGVSFSVLLDQVYGKKWRMAEELLFTCTDGYQPSVPSEKFARFPNYLAYERVGQDFILANKLQNEAKINLGPFYLIWENLKTEAMRAEDLSDWPYQVVSVDLISFQDKFPNLAPPQGSSSQQKRGFLVWRRQCMTCHTINGEGGKKAPELNYPANVLEYYNEKWLKKWISEPTQIRLNTTMPAFNREAKDREAQIQAVIAYLKAMGKKKRHSP